MQYLSLCVVVVFLALFSLVTAYPAAEQRTIDLDTLVRVRCSLRNQDETMFYFNGSIFAFTPTGNTLLFKGVGVNVGRCFKKADGSFTLASREVLYYLNPSTNEIINSWKNWKTNETVNVAHVDNDPVIQNFTAGSTYSSTINGDDTILTMDVPLFYPNALFFNPAMAPYSPQQMYQASEMFKFIVKTEEAFSDDNTVSSNIVSWTRTGPYLPWMKMGSEPGYLIYSFNGAKIPDWTYLPAQVKNDFATRIPHYQHAPTCIPNTASVTSWSFFSRNFQSYLNGTRFPLANPASYGCANITLAADTSCGATASAVVGASILAALITFLLYP